MTRFLLPSLTRAWTPPSAFEVINPAVFLSLVAPDMRFAHAEYSDITPIRVVQPIRWRINALRHWHLGRVGEPIPFLFSMCSE